MAVSPDGHGTPRRPGRCGTGVRRGALLALAAAAACATAGTDGGRRQNAPSRPVAPTSDVLIHSPLTPCSATTADVSRTLRVASWNIQAARAAPLEDVAVELGKMNADVMALQEVDLRVRRTAFTPQPQVLARTLGVRYVFAASIKYDGGDYGLAVLSRWPLAEVRRHRLDPSEATEHRIVLEVVVCTPGRPLRVFNHHADRREAGRRAGFGEVRAIVQPHLGRGVVLAGDLNDRPTAAGIAALIDAGLVDLGAAQDEPTAAGGRIDYLLVDRLLAKRLHTAAVWRTPLSDHHAVVAAFAW